MEVVTKEELQSVLAAHTKEIEALIERKLANQTATIQATIENALEVNNERLLHGIGLHLRGILEPMVQSSVKSEVSTQLERVHLSFS